MGLWDHELEKSHKLGVLVPKSLACSPFLGPSFEKATGLGPREPPLLWLCPYPSLCTSPEPGMACLKTW